MFKSPIFDQFVHYLAQANRTGITLTRLAIAIVLIWIGSLKFFAYEADGIVPFVANSPFMSFFYDEPQEYGNYMNKEGELKPSHRQWHETNNTYGFSIGLGILLVSMGTLLLLDVISPVAGLVGGVLVFIMSLGTLSFLITTPEAWVPNLGDADYGFPFLSGRGRLVIKDIIMLGGSIVVASDSAQRTLAGKSIRRNFAERKAA